VEIGSTQIIALLITGVGVGFASGLLGVGGCFIMIPVQFWALTSIGVDPTIAIRIAFGTNLAVVLPTAISGAIGHSRKKAVSWKAGIILGLSGLVGSVVGGYFAAHIPGNILKIGFGLAILAGGIRMLTAKPPKVEKESIDSVLLYILWGFPLGIVSGIIGIGGGVLMVPVMVLAMRFQIHQAVGTSTALMIFTSIGGILSYTVNGLNISGLPPYSTGYVNLLQWILLAATSVPMAQVGVRVAHKLPAKQLKYVFIAVMIYMGLKMIGVFAWLHLPI
jgi:uncharacterized membrane protein YfcA